MKTYYDVYQINLNRSVPEARTAVRLAIRRTRQLRGILEARAL